MYGSRFEGFGMADSFQTSAFRAAKPIDRKYVDPGIFQGKQSGSAEEKSTPMAVDDVPRRLQTCVFELAIYPVGLYGSAELR